MAIIGRNDEIWPEIGSWGVLNRFVPRFDTLSHLDRFLWNFKKMQFLRFWIMIFGHFRAGRIFYGSKIGQISPGTNFYGSPPFPKKWGRSVGAVLDLQQNMWVYAKSRKLHILLKCCFWCFCCFFGATPCCFSKNLKSELFLNIYIVGQILNRKKVMALWKSDSGAVLTYLWWFHLWTRLNA